MTFLVLREGSSTLLIWSTSGVSENGFSLSTNCIVYVWLGNLCMLGDCIICLS